MRHRTDANQQAIIDALTKVGRVPILLSGVGGGVPDLLVPRFQHIVYAYDLFELWELKVKGNPLTPDQERFHRRYHVRVVTSVDEALQAVGVKA